MNKSTILNKLKLLNLRNPWQVSIVKELSNRRGASALIDPLFRDSRKRLKADRDPNAKKKFNQAVADLIKYGLLFEKIHASGLRLHLLISVWQLEDAIIESIAGPTIALSQGRKNNINWKTILKEVRKELTFHNIKLSHQVTKTLVYYFLLRRCGWKLLSNNHLSAPKKSRKKSPESPEKQPDLFD